MTEPQPIHHHCDGALEGAGIALALELKYGAEHLLLPQVLEELRQGATVEQLQSLQVAIRTTPTLETLWQEHMLDTVTPDPDRLPKGSTN